MGEVLRGDPPLGSYAITEVLGARWGRLRYRAVRQDDGEKVELWCAPGAGALPGPLGRLLPLRHRHLQTLWAVGTAEGRAVAVLSAPSGLPLEVRGIDNRPLRVLAVVQALSSALDALHAAGLCHLELRPEHVFCGDAEDDVVLGGLGRIALEAQPLPEVSSSSRIIDAGEQPALLRICAYLAPEQILPERAALIHRRTDVYALAALGFHLLCGAPPFGPDGEMATLGAHLAAWRPLCSAHRPDLGEAVDAVLQRGLALDPQDRPPSCGELCDDLRATLATMQQPAAAGSALGPCVLVVAGSAAPRRELQGMIAAISPRTPVLADGGAHTLTLALRYRPQIIVLHQPSLSEPLVLDLCRSLCSAQRLQSTQVVVVLGQTQGAGVLELAQLGVTLALGSSPSSTSSSQSVQLTPGGRPLECRPLVQILRRVLQPQSSRSTSRRPGP